MDLKLGKCPCGRFRQNPEHLLCSRCILEKATTNKRKGSWRNFGKETDHKVISNKPDLEKSSYAEVLKQQGKLQTLWSKNITDNFADKYGYLFCLSCKKSSKKGLFGIHAGHLYEKAEYWPLAAHPFNGAPQCSNCNVNQGGQQLEFRRAMIKEIGADIIAELEVLAETIARYQKSGVINVRARFANISFIEAEIKRIKSGDFFDTKKQMDNIRNYALNIPLESLRQLESLQ